MIQKDFIFCAIDGVEIYVHKWLPEGQIKAAVNIAHGMAETAARYESFASALTNSGYAVYAEDHRGHGRTINDPALSGDAGIDALNKMLGDLHQVSGIIKKEILAKPLFLFGHSMGSFLTQGYIARWGKELQGAILSGTAAPANIVVALGQFVAYLEVLRVGRRGKSKLLNELSFGNFSRQFKPFRTAFDWLSRDEAEVDKYMADPFCGGIFPAGFFYDLLKFLRRLHRADTLADIPVDLPLYFFSGGNDPVGDNTNGVRRLINLYRRTGVKNLQFKFYDGGRHEMLHELNSEEVIKDVIEWLDKQLLTGNR